MLSDGRLVERPLLRADCDQCGLASHASPPETAEVTAYFQEGYGLYAHEPGRAPERVRQTAYAAWIAASIEPERFRDVVEVGCGNGSLLLELRRLLPSARFRGIEPSPEASRQARAAGLEVRQGFVEEVAHLGGHDLVVSVNVIEHSPDPVRFLAALGALTRPGGRIVVVCPDGSEPSTELLFFDHLFSLTAAALSRFAARAGLRVERSSSAPAALGPFRLYVLGREPGALPWPAPRSLHTPRVAYFEAWRRLDPELLARVADASLITAFGAGEAALLLRAYAPGVWSRVRRLSVDTPTDDSFCGLPVKALAGLEVAPEEVLLLAVRPPDQPGLAERLAGRWKRLVRWDDIVAF